MMVKKITSKSIMCWGSSRNGTGSYWRIERVLQSTGLSCVLRFKGHIEKMWKNYGNILEKIRDIEDHISDSNIALV